MKHLIACLALIASPLAAQDFSEGSEARSWNLYAEIPARFEAKVVDDLSVLEAQVKLVLRRIEAGEETCRQLISVCEVIVSDITTQVVAIVEGVVEAYGPTY